MSARNSAAPNPVALFSQVRQVCTVVDHLEQTVTNLIDHFGIGPFRCWRFEASRLHDTTLHGRPAAWSMKVGVTWLADVQWEVIEPLDGATLYRKHLEAHGPGVEHLLMDTGAVAFATAAERLARGGQPFAQSGWLNSRTSFLGVTLTANWFTHATGIDIGYTDTERTLGTNLEFVRRPLGLSHRSVLRRSKPDYCMPAHTADFEKPLSNLQVRRLVKVGIVTRDLEAALGHWITLGGVRPWHVFDLGPDRLRQVSLDGGQARFSLRVAWAVVDDVLIELVQPNGGASPYQALIDTRGEAVGWVGLCPRLDFEDVVKHCEALGYAKRLQGPLLGSHAAAWFGARNWLGTDIEILRLETDVGALFNAITPDRVVTA